MCYADGVLRLLDRRRKRKEAAALLAARSKTVDRISERPPRGGLSFLRRSFANVRYWRLRTIQLRSSLSAFDLADIAPDDNTV
jgi:hypothetical protein